MSSSTLSGSGGLRVLFVIGALSGGGAERQLRLLVDALSKRGCSVHVAALQKGLTIAPGDYPCAVTALRGAQTVWWRARAELQRLLRHHDVVYSWLDVANVFTAWANTRTQIPHFWGVRGAGPEEGWVAWAARGLSRLLHQRATAVVANSHSVVRYYERSLNFRPRAWHVIPNAVRPVDSTGAGIPKNDGHFLVGCVARFHPVKNHRLVLAVFARASERLSQPMTLVLAGSGMSADNRALVEMIDEFGQMDRVHLMGAVSPVDPVLRSLDVTLCLSEHEGASNVALESVMAGTPVVSTDTGDVSDWLAGCGRVVAPDIDQASAALVELLEAPVDKAALQTKASELRQARSASDIAQQVFELLESAI